jgi:hypothetical protein
MTFSVRRLHDPRELATLTGPGWPQLSAEEIVQHGADDALGVFEGDALCARCSLWSAATPPLEGHHVGAIGHFGASDIEPARMLLSAACARLRQLGCTIAVGPMDGNTWRRYRLVIERGAEPPFFLEPDNPPDWPEWFSAAEFEPLSHYYSSINIDLSQSDPRAAAAEARLATGGVRVRNMDVSRFEHELERVHGVAEVAFSKAFLYTPLPLADFMAQYRRIQPYVRPELVFIAEHDDRPVGFAFTIPDLMESARGGTVRTAIIKTVAILPDRERYGGLGTVLVERTHRAVEALGFSRAIHALMHESNYSRNISDRSGHVMRRYALFAKTLPQVERSGITPA